MINCKRKKVPMLAYNFNSFAIFRADELNVIVPGHVFCKNSI